LEDARRSLLGRSKKKDKEKLPSGITADYVSSFYQTDASSEFSFVSGASASPSGSMHSISKTAPPAVPPKPPKRGILKGGPVDAVAPVPERESFFDDRHLLANTIQNELIGYNYENVMNVEGGAPPPPRFETFPSPEEQRKSFGDLNLECPLPTVQPTKPPRARVVEIIRLETGDFGFSLRRATILDRCSSVDLTGRGSNEVKMRQVIFAEPGSLERTNETGLLPGDKLLEVNGVNVESKTRDEIIEMIRSSGNSVTLKVRTVYLILSLAAVFVFSKYERKG
jgi:myosin-18